MINIKKLFLYIFDWFPVVFNNRISCWREQKLRVLCTPGNIKPLLLESLKVRVFNCLLEKMWTPCLATTRSFPVAKHLCIFTNQYLWLPFPTLITLWQNQDALRHFLDTIGGKNRTRIWASLVSGPALRLVGNIFLEEKNINCRLWNSVRRLFWIKVQMSSLLSLDQILQVGIYSELTQNLLLLLASHPSIHKIPSTSRTLLFQFSLCVQYYESKLGYGFHSAQSVPVPLTLTVLSCFL